MLFKKLRRNHKIVCRNIFLFFLLFKQNGLNTNIKNISVFIKPRKYGVFTTLRAPYRYKLGRNQYNFQRFLITLSFSLKIRNDLTFMSLSNLILFVKICKNFFPWFETNLCYQHKYVLKLPFKTDYFNLNNYKHNN